MDRRSFLLAIPFIAVASKVVKTVPVIPKIYDGELLHPFIMDEVGMCHISDARTIAWLDAHPRNAAHNKHPLLFTTVETIK